jgi:hypothetical protein
MAKAAKPKKKVPSRARATKYKEKLQVNASFEELAKVLLRQNNPYRENKHYLSFIIRLLSTCVHKFSWLSFVM